MDSPLPQPGLGCEELVESQGCGWALGPRAGEEAMAAPPAGRSLRHSLDLAASTTAPVSRGQTELSGRSLCQPHRGPLRMSW